MKLSLLLLLISASAVAHAQQGLPPRGASFMEQEQSGSNRKQVQYAENRARCQEALRVADLCGKFKGQFECSDRGFRAVAANPARKPVATDGTSSLKMDQCVRNAARQQP